MQHIMLILKQMQHLVNYAGIGQLNLIPITPKTPGRAIELNRRRHPFQNAAFEYFRRFTSRRGLP